MQPEIDASKPSRFYRSYLIRLWRDHAQAPLHVSLLHVQTGREIRFATLAKLFTFLELQQPDEESDSSSPALPPKQDNHEAA